MLGSFLFVFMPQCQLKSKESIIQLKRSAEAGYRFGHIIHLFAIKILFMLRGTKHGISTAGSRDQRLTD